MNPLYLFKAYLNHILKEFKKGKYGQEDKETTEGHKKPSEAGIKSIKNGQKTGQDCCESEEDEKRRLLSLE